MFGGRGSPGNPGGGLPFAGIPSELQDGVDRLLTDRAGAPRAHRHLHLRESRRRRPEAEPAEPAARTLAAGPLGRRPGRHRQCLQPGRPDADRHRHQPRPRAPQGLHRYRGGLGRLSGLRGHHRGGSALHDGSHRPAGRLGHERPAGQDLHSPAAIVARLLHRGEGGRDHEPNDERYREPSAAAPGWPGAVRGAGPHHDRDHVHHARR